MKPYKSKINKIRSFALALIFFGMIIMYGAVFFRDHVWLVILFSLLGCLSILASVIIYAWIGFLSTRAVIVQCPSCEKQTKVLGRVDLCMYCNEPLTLDPVLAGQPFDESYNSKKRQKV